MSPIISARMMHAILKVKMAVMQAILVMLTHCL
jgi:hypothetical protein